MTDQHPTSRLPGLARLFALVVLLGGIVGMHVGVFDLGHAWAGAHHEPALAASEHLPGAGPVEPVAGVLVSADVGVTAGHGVTAAPHTSGTPPSTAAARPEAVTSPHTIANPSALTSADHAATGTAVNADLRESALLAGAFAPPLLSVEALGGHEQDCGDCGAHGGMHACVFILSLLALAIGLVLLFRLAFQPLNGHETLGGHRPARRERPPPWTMPTLSELSILRI